MSFLEKPIFDLLQNEPFYANFILGSTIILNDKRIERAAVTIRRNEVQFIFNTEWFATLTAQNRVAIIKHEIGHLLFGHCNIRSGKTNRMARNIAMDAAINQLISDLPEGAVTLESMEKLCKKQLLPRETYEYYYEQMKQVAEQNGSGDGEPSDHDIMFEGDGMDEKLHDAIIKDRMNKAIKASAGKIPQELESYIAKINQPAVVNWKQQLRNIISSSRSIATKPSRMKTHRRFDLEQPGKKKKRELVLGVCLDSSGSVSDDSYMEFMREVHSISKNTTITYLIHADCEVQKVDIIKGGKPKSGVLSKRHGHGGTAYQPGIDECMNRECDAIIFFGDFDCADTPVDPGIPFVWVGVGNSPAPGNFGRVIRI